MQNNIQHYFLKLNPPRKSFMLDMTEDERKIMQQHVAYWDPYVKDGTVIVLGPVMDISGGYGIAVIGVESEERLKDLIKNDPGNGLNSYEWHPMRAVTR
jgi:hypothetical protein